MAKKRTTGGIPPYVGIIGLFWTVFGIMALVQNNRARRQPAPEAYTNPLWFVMLALAAFRMGRLIAYDKVAEPLRAPFTKTVPDDSGAGETVVARRGGIRNAVGELLSCPICAGTWISAGLVYGLELLPGPTRMLITIMSAIGLGELLNSLTEALSWLGQAERQEVGSSQSRPKVGQVVGRTRTEQ